MIRRAAAWIVARGPAMLVLALAAGLAVPDLARVLAAAVVPAAVVAQALSLVRIAPAELLGVGRRAPLMVVALAGVLCLAPAAVVGALALTGAGATDPALGLALYAMAPPLLSAPAFAVMLGLDVVLAAALALAGTLLAPLTVPLLAAWLLGVALALDPVDLALRLFGLVALIFGGALVLRRVLGPAGLARHAVAIDLVMIAALMTFACGAMDLVGAEIRRAPLHVLVHVAAATGINVAFQAVTIAVAWPLGPRTALTLALIAGNRNAILMVAAVGLATAPELTLFFVASQLPLFLMPAAAQPVFGWLRRRAGEAC